MPSVDDRCSLRSLAAGEPLAGTASTIRHWLLIEHPGPWGRDGLVDARLPDGLGTQLRALERRTGARVLLVRRPALADVGGAATVSCLAIDTADAWLGSVALGEIAEATELDPRDRSVFIERREPVFVVCTHGRRDPCCAERGRPLARELAASHPGLTWESTHVGGDRFAANLVAFPHGCYFGRVAPTEGSEIAAAYAEGRIARLDHYRGRSSDPFHVQAAERALRERLSLDRIDAVSPQQASRRGERADVVFATELGPHRVALERVLGTPMRLTCHAADEESPPAWRTLEIEPVGE